MRNIVKKITLSISVFLGTFLTLAQAVPAPPPQPEAGDIGGPATPIDMYVYLLVLVASMITLYYKRRLKFSKN